MPKHWEQREKKLNKRRLGMRVVGRSVFVIQEATRDRARKIAAKEKEKQTNG